MNTLTISKPAKYRWRGQNAGRGGPNDWPDVPRVPGGLKTRLMPRFPAPKVGTGKFPGVDIDAVHKGRT
jgi:hypothetical protein